MRFERLTVERFGHFDNLDLDLSGGPGMVVIYGPNEAGKTTLLRALHGLLFGIDERTAYAFEYDYRAIALRAVLRDTAGQRLVVTRLKKRKDSLLGSMQTDVGEQPLDAARFARYFGAITEDLYRSIFGFSHADVQQGSEVLQVAGLSELLGGGALGGSAEKIRGALSELQLECDNLFKAKGKNPAINRGLTHLRDARLSLREAVFQQPQYAALTQSLAHARDEADASEQGLARLRERDARLHTLLAVFEDFHEHLGLQRALADPSLDSPLDDAAAERARALYDTATAARARLLALDAELARLLARAEQPAADHALLAEAAAVERLVRRVETTGEQRQALPRERERWTRDGAALAAVLGDLSPGTSPEDHARWSLPPGELDRLRALSTRWLRARQELQLVSRNLADDEAELAALQASVADLSAAAPDPEDMALLAELEAASARRAELEREQQTAARLRAELDLALARLRPPLPPALLADEHAPEDMSRAPGAGPSARTRRPASAGPPRRPAAAHKDVPTARPLSDEELARERVRAELAGLSRELAELLSPSPPRRGDEAPVTPASAGLAPAPDDLSKTPDEHTAALTPAPDDLSKTPAEHTAASPPDPPPDLDAPPRPAPAVTEPAPSDLSPGTTTLARRLGTLPLPLPAELDDFHARALDRERDRRAALADLSRETEELTHARAALAALAATDLPDPDALPSARTRRDELWTEIRQRLVSGEAQPFGALFARAAADYVEPEPEPARARPDTVTARRQLAKAFERAVSSADALADRLRDAADDLAQRTSLLRQVERSELAVRRAELRLAELARAETEWSQAWTDLWRPLRLAPLAPPAMLAWSRDASAVRDLAAELVRHEDAAERARPAVDAFVARLRARLGWPAAAFPALAQGLRDRERAAQAARARLEASAARLSSLRSAVARGRAARDALSRELLEIDATLRARLSGFDLPADLDPDAALARLEALFDLSQKLRELETRRAALARAEAAVAGFDAELDALLVRLDLPRTGLSPEHTVDALGRRLAEARTAAAAAAQAREQAEAKQHERNAAADTQSAALAELAALAERAAAVNVHALLDMSERTVQRTRLQRRLGELAVRLTRALGDGPPRDAYVAELSVARRESLLAEQAELTRRLGDLDRRRTIALEQKGKLDNQLQALGGDRAARLNADCEAMLADLGQQVDRYVLLQLAQQVLARVTERYARENQPALLHYTSELLATITGGRHIRVVPQPEAGTLAAIDRVGRLRLPHELSLGTREQLFLALRLAYVLDYCDRNEPLPLVMDDVLVNFDEDRARTTLQALRDVARTTQVLFLTCHRHLMQLARQTAPTGADLHVVELPGPPVAPVPRPAEA